MGGCCAALHQRLRRPVTGARRWSTGPGALHVLCRTSSRLTVGATFSALGATAGILTMDSSSASSMAARDWPLVVLIMDLLMVIGIGLRVQLAIVATTVLALAVVEAEQFSRFGLFNLVNPSGDVRGVCDCATPLDGVLGFWPLLSLPLLAWLESKFRARSPQIVLLSTGYYT
eukprot:TRINITY_DN11635_c0_g1_i1.p2 TRINITY_DN11635_c0_g1~~TRINITY_DN11635_c0_g1_i1.p2  ORF type:complete len:200 (+),score=17.25 TRINITY_DN11635_c0_g1_i1:84-602(+)